MKTLFLALLIILSNLGFANTRPHILFVSIDDLRPELGCYGSQIAVTPHLDAFAKSGLQFNRAYCQQAICGPSRASLLTGLRPESSGVFHNYVKIRELVPEVITLPQHFGNNGYRTLYHGKIFHHGDLDPASWNSQPPKERLPLRGGFALPENQKARAETRKEMTAKYGDVARLGLAMGPAFEAADVPDNTYIDGFQTDLAIKSLATLLAQEEGKPFFLALGFSKPHLNWVAPKRYWDLYDREKLTLTKQPDPPKNGAMIGLHPSFELRVRSGIPKLGPIPEDLARTLLHSYLACVSYVDAQFGRMMAALEQSKAHKNTIVIVWSDHGYHLGEMGLWGKATNYELGTRVPLLIQTPDLATESRGQATDALVELIDIYPTLCELAGLETPDHVEGTSFLPLLSQPSRPWKKAAFSQFPSPALREWGAFPIRPAMRETYFGPLLNEVETRIKKQIGDKWDRDLFENKLMGYAMRTDRYRFIEWRNFEDPETAPVFTELYDHKNDPLETNNIAEESPKLVSELSKQLANGWQQARP